MALHYDLTHKDGKLNPGDENRLTPHQIASLENALHAGSVAASKALSRWVERSAIIELDSLQWLPVDQVTSVLSTRPQPISFCAVDMQGILTGQMIFAFDDVGGLALSDVLQGQPVGTTGEWTEMSQSIVLETTNIVCCAYLNSLAEHFTDAISESGTESLGQVQELLPGPPRFNREFAESLMQFVVIAQAMEFDQIIFAETSFRVEGTPVDGTLLFVPDADSRRRLATWGTQPDG